MSETQMTDSTTIVTTGTANLADQLDVFRDEELQPFTREIEQLFDGLGDSITDTLTEAAERGRVNASAIIDDVLADLTRIAADQFVRQPLEQALGSIFGGATGTAPAASTPLGRSETQLASLAQRTLSRANRNA